MTLASLSPLPDLLDVENFEAAPSYGRGARLPVTRQAAKKKAPP